MKAKETVKSMMFHGKRWLFLSSFFSANKYIFGGGTCKLCKKKHLGKDERVDVEFFGGDIESYCLSCWPSAIFAKNIIDAVPPKHEREVITRTVPKRRREPNGTRQMIAQICAIQLD